MPFLQRHLPFWITVALTQLGLVLLPVVGIAYPLLRGIPALYSGWIATGSTICTGAQAGGDRRGRTAGRTPRGPRHPAGPAGGAGQRDACHQRYLQTVYFLRQRIDLDRSRMVRS